MIMCVILFHCRQEQVVKELWKNLKKNEPELLGFFEDFVHRASSDIKKAQTSAGELENALRRYVEKDWNYKPALVESINCAKLGNLIFFFFFVLARTYFFSSPRLYLIICLGTSFCTYIKPNKGIKGKDTVDWFILRIEIAIISCLKLTWLVGKLVRLSRASQNFKWHWTSITFLLFSSSIENFWINHTTVFGWFY